LEKRERIKVLQWHKTLQRLYFSPILQRLNKNLEGIFKGVLGMSNLIELWKEKDWDSIIAKAKIDGNCDFHSTFAKMLKQNNKSNQSNYDDVIADVSETLIKNSDNTKNARLIRAFVYYLTGNYEQAIFDCKKFEEESFAKELLGMIYLNKGEYEKANEQYEKLLFNDTNIENLLKSPLLLEAYIKICKKLKGV